ncbi:MAG: Cytochrome heme domain [Acidobacteriota bacterium]|jgi:Tol biopolymer transport system component|nr:Cytochrome heme domain [Acidobacteriota bacterium]
MRFLRALLLCLLGASPALAQEKPVVEYRGNFGLHVVNDSIRWSKYLEDEDKLLLVGFQNLQVIDLPNTKVVETRPINLPFEKTRGGYSTDDWELSPDGRRMLIFGHPEALDGKRKLGWVWDVREGKRLAVLDKSPSDLRSGVWSKDGKAIVTSDRHFKYINNDEQNEWNHVFSFWDGETYEYRGAVTLENVMWWHLSDDGRHFFAATGRTKRSIVGVKYVSDSAGMIGVWDTRTGQLERTIAVGDENFNPRTREIEVSPDGKYLVFTNKHKSNPAEHRLLAWEMNGSIQPKYELKPQPKIDDSRVVFSPDGRYFALDVGRNLQIYETRTGEKKYELTDVELPHTWLNNDIILDVHPKHIYGREKSDKMFAVDAATGKVLYKSRLTFREEVEYSYASSDDETVIIYTSVVAHPAGKMFLTYDYEYVRIFDTRTGELLQTVISPPVKLDKDGKTVYDKEGKPKLNHGAAVKWADWSRDGRTLYVFSANGQSVSVYGLVGN